MKLKTALILTLISCFGFFMIESSAAAATPTISKAYSASSPIDAGSIVRLLPGAKSIITVANSDNPKGLIGVVEPNNGSLLAINPSLNTLQVAISGEAETLVSTVNGNIKQGDYIAVSPFGGMGMDSSAGDSVVGFALSSFSSKSPGAKEQKVVSKSGSSGLVWSGEIPVNIAVGIDNANGNKEINSLQKLARSLTGHTISTVRIVAALILAIVAFTTLVTLTYSATYSSLISIGRNPLAKFEILKSLRSIVVALIVIALVAGLLIYLLLS